MAQHSNSTEDTVLAQGSQISFEAIGTRWLIELGGQYETQKLHSIEQAVRRRVRQFDKTYSRFRDDSLVAAMARQAGTYRLPADAKSLLDAYRQFYTLTDGALTPLIGQTLADAGYDAAYSFDPKPLQLVPHWGDLLEYRFPELRLQAPALLDFGALGKGYLIDIVGSLLERAGVRHFCINAGGDLLHASPSNSKLSVALEHPDDVSQAIGVAQLGQGSLCGSAGNRRAWAGYHHIIDPRALQSPRHLKAVWTYAETALLADGLSTALFFVEPEILAKAFDFEYALVKADNSLQASTNFPATFFG